MFFITETRNIIKIVLFIFNNNFRKNTDLYI